jgi:hypothetical protein
VYTGILTAFYVILVDTVVNNVPLVGSRNLQYRVVSGTINLALGILTKDDWLLSHFNGAERRLRGSVCNVIVARTSIVHRPKEIVEAIAIEHIRSFAISIVAE